MRLDPDAPRPAPQEDPHRPFGIADAMILIAALFVALAWDRDRLLDPFRYLTTGPRGLTGMLWRLALAGADVIEVFPPLLTVGSLAVLALRLRKPRPAWPRLLRQPGTVACALASLAMLPLAASVLAAHLLAGRPPAVAWSRAVDDLQPENLTGMTILIGLGVLVSWVVLTAKRRLRPDPGWVDRLGRLVGVGWIAMLPGGLLLAIVRLARLL